MTRTPADILGDRLRTVLALTEANAALRLALSQSNGARLDVMSLEDDAEDSPDPEALAEAQGRDDVARARMAEVQARIAALDAELDSLDREIADLPR